MLNMSDDNWTAKSDAREFFNGTNRVTTVAERAKTLPINIQGLFLAKIGVTTQSEIDAARGDQVMIVYHFNEWLEDKKYTLGDFFAIAKEVKLKAIVNALDLGAAYTDWLNNKTDDDDNSTDDDNNNIDQSLFFDLPASTSVDDKCIQRMAEQIAAAKLPAQQAYATAFGSPLTVNDATSNRTDVIDIIKKILEQWLSGNHSLHVFFSTLPHAFLQLDFAQLGLGKLYSLWKQQDFVVTLQSSSVLVIIVDDWLQPADLIEFGRQCAQPWSNIFLPLNDPVVEEGVVSLSFLLNLRSGQHFVQCLLVRQSSDWSVDYWLECANDVGASRVGLVQVGDCAQSMRLYLQVVGLDGETPNESCVNSKAAKKWSLGHPSFKPIDSGFESADDEPNASADTHSDALKPTIEDFQVKFADETVADQLLGCLDDELDIWLRGRGAAIDPERAALYATLTVSPMDERWRIVLAKVLMMPMLATVESEKAKTMAVEVHSNSNSDAVSDAKATKRVAPHADMIAGRWRGSVVTRFRVSAAEMARIKVDQWLNGANAALCNVDVRPIAQSIVAQAPESKLFKRLEVDKSDANVVHVAATDKLWAINPSSDLPSPPQQWLTALTAQFQTLKTFDLPTPIDDNHFICLCVASHADASAAMSACEQPMLMRYRRVQKPYDKNAKDADSVFENKKSLFLLGQAGYGKSTLLRHWSLKEAESGRLALFVRIDELWKLVRDKGVIDVDVLKKACLSSLNVVDEDVQKKFDQINWTILLSNPNITLLLDALDELPGEQRNTPEFEQFLEKLCSLASSGESSLKKVVISSRFCTGVKAPKGFDVAQVMPLAGEQEKAFISSLLTKWKSFAAEEATFAASLMENWANFDVSEDSDFVKSILDAARQFCLYQSPLLLLMMTLLHFTNKQSSTNNLFQTYETVLVLMQERQIRKGSENVDEQVEQLWFAHANGLPSQDQWLRDIFSLFGFVCHYLGARNGSARVPLFDALLLLELIRGNDGNDVIGQDRLYAFLGVTTDADNDVYLDPETRLLIRLNETFGMVSTIGDPRDRLRDQQIVFGHRTFQEFLAARALTCSESLVVRFPLLNTVDIVQDFAWQDGSVLANQWFNQVMLFVAAKQGVDWLFKKMFGDENSAEWSRRLIANDGIDNDLGRSKLTTVLRAVLVGQLSESLRSSLFETLKWLIERKPSDAIDVLYGVPNRELCVTKLRLGSVVESNVQLRALFRD